MKKILSFLSALTLVAGTLVFQTNPFEIQPVQAEGVGVSDTLSINFANCASAGFATFSYDIEIKPDLSGNGGHRLKSNNTYVTAPVGATFSNLSGSYSPSAIANIMYPVNTDILNSGGSSQYITISGRINYTGTSSVSSTAFVETGNTLFSDTASESKTIDCAGNEPPSLQSLSPSSQVHSSSAIASLNLTATANDPGTNDNVLVDITSISASNLGVAPGALALGAESPDAANDLTEFELVNIPAHYNGIVTINGTVNDGDNPPENFSTTYEFTDARPTVSLSTADTIVAGATITIDAVITDTDAGDASSSFSYFGDAAGSSSLSGGTYSFSFPYTLSDPLDGAQVTLTVTGLSRTSEPGSGYMNTILGRSRLHDDTKIGVDISSQGVGYGDTISVGLGNDTVTLGGTYGSADDTISNTCWDVIEDEYGAQVKSFRSYDNEGGQTTEEEWGLGLGVSFGDKITGLSLGAGYIDSGNYDSDWSDPIKGYGSGLTTGLELPHSLGLGLGGVGTLADSYDESGIDYTQAGSYGVNTGTISTSAGSEAGDYIDHTYGNGTTETEDAYNQESARNTFAELNF